MKFMLIACLDESYTKSPMETPYYVVAGFVAEQRQWEEFESLWNESMRYFRIKKIGCHASDCQAGVKDYRHLGAAKRKDIQERLIVDIVTSGLYGVVSAVDMTAYRRVRKNIRDTVAPSARQYMEGPVLAVAQCARQVCQATHKATQEPVEFYLDQNREFGKRTKAWIERGRNNPEDQYKDRYGSCSEHSRYDKIGLQAADMLAYAYFRHIQELPVWQWDALQQAIKMSEFVTGDDFWDCAEEKYVTGLAALA